MNYLEIPPGTLIHFQAMIRKIELLQAENKELKRKLEQKRSTKRKKK